MKKQALIIISSANQLPLSQPENMSINIGFFLPELGKVLETFKDEYEFIFATPNGKKPTLDINGESLSMQAGHILGYYSTKEIFSKDIYKYRENNKKLFDRRQNELNILYELMGKIPVSNNLPATNKEAADYRYRIVKEMETLEEKNFYSLKELIDKNKNPNNNFDFKNLDFVHLPGGHAPMVDFLDNPELGEILNILAENQILTSFICHAPIALTSTKYRIDENNQKYLYPNSKYKNAKITTVPKTGELFMLSTGYPKVKNHKTRLTYYVDKKLESEGFNVETTKNFSKAHIVYDSNLNLLTGNGPQSIDIQTNKIKEILQNKS